ncbi:MAG: hypothetical protein IPN96_14800 [Anaerolineales bacterium]|nr:hypothetical protein [Anaerolineales bacterium]
MGFEELKFFAGNLYVVGSFGAFNTSGTMIAQNLAKWDSVTETWSAVGGVSTIDGWLHTLDVYDGAVDDILYVGGEFTDLNGITTADKVAMYNITTNTWSNMGDNGAGVGSITNAVYAINVDAATGEVYIGGFFTDADGLAAADRIAKWDGSNWSALGNSAITNGLVQEILVINSDNVYISGTFYDINGIAEADLIAKWNGTTSTWSALGSYSGGGALVGTRVRSMVLNGSILYVAGLFNMADPALAAGKNLAKYDTGTGVWSIVDDNGANNTIFHTGDEGPFTLAIASGVLYVGGSFEAVDDDGTLVNNSANFTGMAIATDVWSGYGNGNGLLSQPVHAIAAMGTDVYVGGNFANAGNNPLMDYLIRWDGSAWNPVGTGSSGSLNATVRALAVDGTDLYAGGDFSTVYNNGVQVNGAAKIAKWDSVAETWSALGYGATATTAALNNTVFSIVVLGDDVYAGGSFTDVNDQGTVLSKADTIARWNKTDGHWYALAGGVSDGALSGGTYVAALATDGANIYAGGDFTTVKDQADVVIANAAYLAKWDGTAWSALPGTSAPADNRVSALVFSDNNLYVGGSFLSINNIPGTSGLAKWSGDTQTWAPLGNNTVINVTSIAVDGVNVYVGGNFQNFNDNGTSIAAADYIARWDGSNWSALGGNGAGNGSLGSVVFAVKVVDGDVWVGGDFQDVNNNGSVIPNADRLAVYGIVSAAPTVDTIARSSTNPTSDSSVDFKVTFSKPVTGVDVSDFKLTNTILTGASITSVSGADNIYTVTVNTGTGNGTIRLDVRGTASIQSAAGDFVGPYNGVTSYTVNKETAPTVPVLKLPANKALVADYQPTLDWNDSSQVMALTAGWHYEINVTAPFGYNQTFNTVDNADPLAGLGESQYTFSTPLPANLTFTWKVRAYNDANQFSAWSASRTFRTKPETSATKLATPTLTSPVNDPSSSTPLNNKRPTFTWDAVSGTASYTLQILSGVKVVHTGTINAPLHTYTPAADLLPGTTYTWQVKANGAISGDYSAPFTFITSVNPPKVPVQSAPLNAALVDSTTVQLLKWNVVSAVNTAVPATTYPAAASYQIEYAADSTFTGSTVAIVNSSDPTPTQLSISIGTLSPNRTYYWRIRSWSGTGATGNHSAWSTVRTFRTMLATPVLNLPANSTLPLLDLDNKRPTFSWDEVPGATTYTLQILKQHPKTLLFTVVAQTGTIKAPAYTYTSSADLLPGTTYKWKVKANGTNAGSFSAPFTFTTSGNPPKVPVLFAPANNAVVDSIAIQKQRLDWNPVLGVTTASAATTYPDAASFEVEYSTNSGFVDFSPTNTLERVIVNDNTVLGTHTPPISFLPGRTYYWRVRAWSGIGATGDHSAWSLVRTIRVKFVAPVLGSVTPNGGDLTFTWDSDNGLWTNYTLTIINSTTNKVVKNFTVAAPNTTYTIPAASLPTGNYKWQVKINGLYIPISSPIGVFSK